MIEDLNSLYKDFLKSELVEVAEQLGLDTRSETTSKVLVHRIIDDIVENGVPETEQCSDLMLEFLVAAEICDENGNILGEVTEGDASIPEIEQDVLAEVPPCFGFEDDRDPSCNRCKLQLQCRAMRISKRPPCYGKLFLATDDNCRVCIEAPFCKLALSQSVMKEKEQNG